MELYVALNGRSDAPGTKDSPFISIQNAKEKIRALIAKGLSEAVTVHISEGNYSVPSLLFDMSDSGTAEYTITYVADGNVILNGGVKLDPDIFEHVSGKARECLHEDAKDKVLCTDLTKLGISLDAIGKMCVIGSHNSGFLYDDAIMSPMWCELFINDTRQTVARYPNDEFLNHCGAISEGEGLESKTGVGIAHDKWIKMRNPRSDIYKIDEDTAKRAASWKYAHDLWMFGYPSHDWAAHGTVIRYNRIENIGKKPFRPDGIYWDDGLSGQTAYGNVLINIPKFAFHIGGGRENTVERNIIIKSGFAALKYDDRHREGYLRNGWARKATEYPNGKHWRVLSTAPIRSEIWTSKYPTLAGLKTDPASTDPNDPEFPINPAHSSVRKRARPACRQRIRR